MRQSAQVRFLCLFLGTSRLLIVTKMGHIFAAVGENEFIISLSKLKLIAEVFLCACMKQ